MSADWSLVGPSPPFSTGVANVAGVAGNVLRPAGLQVAQGACGGQQICWLSAGASGAEPSHPSLHLPAAEPQRRRRAREAVVCRGLTAERLSHRLERVSGAAALIGEACGRAVGAPPMTLSKNRATAQCIRGGGQRRGRLMATGPEARSAQEKQSKADNTRLSRRHRRRFWSDA